MLEWIAAGISCIAALAAFCSACSTVGTSSSWYTPCGLCGATKCYRSSSSIYGSAMPPFYGESWYMSDTTAETSKEDRDDLE